MVWKLILIYKEKKKYERVRVSEFKKMKGSVVFFICLLVFVIYLLLVCDWLLTEWEECSIPVTFV